MPRKNIIKVYVENAFYHLYNRGINKQIIFQDDQDYKTFLYFLKKYLSPLPKDRPFAQKQSLYKEIYLLAYCLMPNHFHLLVHQKTATAITKLSRFITTCYSMYYNKRHHRSGSLFESRYKAVIIKTDEQLLHLSRYIHLNPVVAKLVNNAQAYPYSSFPYYLGQKKAKWLKPKTILSFFSKKSGINSYHYFVSKFTNLSKNKSNLLKPIILEN